MSQEKKRLAVYVMCDGASVVVFVFLLRLSFHRTGKTTSKFLAKKEAGERGEGTVPKSKVRPSSLHRQTEYINIKVRSTP